MSPRMRKEEGGEEEEVVFSLSQQNSDVLIEGFLFRLEV